MSLKGKILVVLTGGTIGSTCSDGVRGIIGDSPYILIREFRKKYHDYSDCEFEVINPYSILSENLTCEVWSLLYGALYQVDTSEYDGIIITHGSDTLAYTSAAMGMLMRHTQCPIVLTAAERLGRFCTERRDKRCVCFIPQEFGRRTGDLHRHAALLRRLLRRRIFVLRRKLFWRRAGRKFYFRNVAAESVARIHAARIFSHCG